MISSFQVGLFEGITKSFSVVNNEVAFLSSTFLESMTFCIIADFSKEQRAFIHKLANRMHLKSVSYGSGDSRQLTIQRYRSAGQLLQQLLEQGGQTGKYRIVTPSQPNVGKKRHF